MSLMVDSLLNMVLSHWSAVRCQCFLAKHILAMAILSVSRGFLAAHLEGRFSLERSTSWIRLTDICWKPGTSLFSSLADLL